MNEGSSQAATSATPSPTSQPSASPAAAVASQTNPSASSASAAPAGDAGGSSAAPAQTTENTVDLAKLLGDEYSKDPMFKDFKDIKDLAKSFKETKSMVGKPRFDVPGQDAPPEQVSEFYKKLGVPETADAYGLKPDANVPEHANETNVAFLKAFTDVAHEMKLTKSQAEGMQKFFDDMTVNVGKTAEAKQAEEDAQLDSFFDKALGAEKTVASERIKELIEKVIPDEMKPILHGKINNEALTAIALLEKHFRETYGQSDKNAGDPGANAGKSLADLRKEASDLYGDMMKKGLMHPDYKANKERYDLLYKQIGELTNAQNKK